MRMSNDCLLTSPEMRIQNGIYLFRVIEQNIPKHIFVKSQYESVLNQLTCPMFYSYMTRVFKVIMIIFRDSVYEWVATMTLSGLVQPIELNPSNDLLRLPVITETAAACYNYTIRSLLDWTGEGYGPALDTIVLLFLINTPQLVPYNTLYPW